MKKRQSQQRKYPSSSKFHHSDHHQISDYAFKDRSSTMHESDKHKYYEDVREQFRSTLQDVEQYKLKSQLESQKRLVAEQLLKSTKSELEEVKQENEQLRRDLTKCLKKYNKMKEKRQCQKCKEFDDINDKLEKERAIYFNDRAVLKDQIKTLKIQLQNSEVALEREKLELLADTLKKQVIAANRKIEQQTKMINFMSEKLSLYELQNIRIMNNLDLLDNRFQEIQFEKSMNRRACPNCNKNQLKKKHRPNHSFHEGDKDDQHQGKGYIQHQKPLSHKRKTGSIKNIKHKEEIEREQYLEDLQRYQG